MPEDQTTVQETLETLADELRRGAPEAASAANGEPSFEAACARLEKKLQAIPARNESGALDDRIRGLLWRLGRFEEDVARAETALERYDPVLEASERVSWVSEEASHGDPGVGAHVTAALEVILKWGEHLRDEAPELAPDPPEGTELQPGEHFSKEVRVFLKEAERWGWSDNAGEAAREAGRTAEQVLKLGRRALQAARERCEASRSAIRDACRNALDVLNEPARLEAAGHVAREGTGVFEELLEAYAPRERRDLTRRLVMEGQAFHALASSAVWRPGRPPPTQVAPCLSLPDGRNALGEEGPKDGPALDDRELLQVLLAEARERPEDLLPVLEALLETSSQWATRARNALDLGGGDELIEGATEELEAFPDRLLRHSPRLLARYATLLESRLSEEERREKDHGAHHRALKDLLERARAGVGREVREAMFRSLTEELEDGGPEVEDDGLMAAVSMAAREAAEDGSTEAVHLLVSWLAATAGQERSGILNLMGALEAVRKALVVMPDLELAPKGVSRLLSHHWPRVREVALEDLVPRLTSTPESPAPMEDAPANPGARKTGPSRANSPRRGDPAPG